MCERSGCLVLTAASLERDLDDWNVARLYLKHTWNVRARAMNVHSAECVEDLM